VFSGRRQYLVNIQIKIRFFITNAFVHRLYAGSKKACLARNTGCNPPLNKQNYVDLTLLIAIMKTLTIQPDT